jgi:hypothetical protein
LIFISTPPEPPPTFPNRCTNHSDAPVRREIGKQERLPTLVIYVYAETEKIKKDNFEFFLEYPYI